jgi:hypothetical protein
MTPFDRRWQHLAAAARRAPGTPIPSDIDRVLSRAVSVREDWILPRRLGWFAAACLFACALSIPWMAEILAPPQDLAPLATTLPTLSTLPTLPTLRAIPRPPSLPPPPTLPDVHTLVQSLISEESVR